MRIARSLFILFILVCVWLGAGPLVVAGQPKYGVRVMEAKPAALAKARTYVWTVSRPSFNKKVDTLIVAAVDRELGARGLNKLPSGPSDVTVTYASVGRTDVDVKNAPKSGVSGEFAVGTLIIDLSDPTNRQLLFRVRLDTPIATDAATFETTINAAVAAMFDKYPPPPKR
jgi:hypothetical protein